MSKPKSIINIVTNRRQANKYIKKDADGDYLIIQDFNCGYCSCIVKKGSKGCVLEQRGGSSCYAVCPIYTKNERDKQFSKAREERKNK